MLKKKKLNMSTRFVPEKPKKQKILWRPKMLEKALMSHIFILIF